MTGPRRLVVMMACATPLLVACGPQRMNAPQRPGQALIVLLPDPNDGTSGRAVVSNRSGTADLAAARASTLVAVNHPPASVTVMSDTDVQRLFGDALSALPSPALHFTLYFPLESEEPTEQSRALVPEVLRAVESRPFPDVVVVGHTDATGTSASNYQLGLRRANTVRAVLVAAGLDASLVEIASHGEADPLVATADEVFEPRNRRVEITVR